MSDTANLAFAITHGVKALTLALIVGVNAPWLAKINVARQLTHNQNINPDTTSGFNVDAFASSLYKIAGRKLANKFKSLRIAKVHAQDAVDGQGCHTGASQPHLIAPHPPFDKRLGSG